MKKKNREKYRPPSVHSYWSYKNFEPYLKKINNAVVLCIIIITKRFFFCNIMERFFGETWKTIFYFGETCKWIFKDGELVKEHTWWNVKMKIIVSEWWIGKCIFLVNGESPTKTYQFVTPVPKSDIWFESYTPHGNTRILHPFWRKSIENKIFYAFLWPKTWLFLDFWRSSWPQIKN